MSVTWNFPHDSQNKHTCKKLLFSNDYDVQLLINTLILVLFLIGTQNCFFVTRSDKTKKIFLYFNIGVVTPQMFFGNKGEKNIVTV